MAKSEAQKQADAAERQAAREAKLAAQKNATPLETKQTSDVVVPPGATVIASQNQLAGIEETPEVREARIAGERAAYQQPHVPEEDEGTMVTATCGAFILKAPVYERGTTELIEEGNTLVFTGGRVVVDADTLDLVEKAIAGKLGAAKKQSAVQYQLTVVTKGKLPPPMSTWDTLPEDQVLNVAGAAGHLANQHAVQYALDYELSKPVIEKAEPGKPYQRPAIVHWLTAMQNRGLDAPLHDSVAPGSDLTFAIG